MWLIKLSRTKLWDWLRVWGQPVKLYHNEPSTNHSQAAVEALVARTEQLTEPGIWWVLFCRKSSELQVCIDQLNVVLFVVGLRPLHWLQHRLCILKTFIHVNHSMSEYATTLFLPTVFLEATPFLEESFEDAATFFCCDSWVMSSPKRLHAKSTRILAQLWGSHAHHLLVIY